MISFFHKIIDVLNDTKIPYMLSGSMAMSMYALPRATRDFDFVVYMQAGMVPKFLECFREGYYFDEDSIKEAIKNNGIFNIIDHKTQFKADFILMKDTEYGIDAFNRRIETEFFGRSFFVISVEDLLLAKFIWIQQLQSALQMEDIRLLSKLQALDWQYVKKWVKKMNLKTFNLLKFE